MIEPLSFSFDVDCSVGHAFDVWTRKFAAWWPADHTATGRPDLTVVLEPRLGGRIFERTPEGVEHEWGSCTPGGSGSALTDPAGGPGTLKAGRRCCRTIDKLSGSPQDNDY